MKVEEALEDIDWINAMHEELHNFDRNYLSIFVLLVAKHPFGTDDVVVVVGLLNQCPNLVPLKVV